ncbi:MAG: DUF2336 domain-containing protein [Pseudomonadota bacterium]
MTVTRFAMLADLAKETTSEGRRELLRRVTEALDPAAPLAGDEIAAFDDVLSAIASDYSTQVRAQIARLIASSLSPFSRSAQRFAMDDIEVARPILEHSEALTEATLLRVVNQKSQHHMMAVTRRRRISEAVSHALVERGDDAVVTSLLTNQRAEIGAEAYGMVAKRAETSPVLQAPLVRRSGVPVELLNDLYMKVEADLRREIVGKFESVPPEELEAAFRRSRTRLSNRYSQPEDFELSKRRIDGLQRGGGLIPQVLASLMREGPAARTAFKIAFARLTDVEFDLIERVVEGQDLDTAALLCRGSNFDKALFVSLAVGLDRNDRGLGGANEFGKIYESVPIHAAQRAIRFWKIRAAA